MGTDGKLVAGYVLLGVGALLIVIAIILVIFLIQRRNKNGKSKRSSSPDTFKIVYKVPTANGVTTKVATDAVDSRSMLTLRSEPGYHYVAPPSERPISPLILSPPPVVTTPPPPPLFVGSHATLPRAASVDHVAVTLPRTGERYIVPAPNGTLPRILVPVSKKKGKKYKRSSHGRPRFIYGTSTGAASVISAPAYATSVRSATSHGSKYYLYGSTPNLAAAEFTQPVLTYDPRRDRIFSDDLIGAGSSHVQNWLARERPTSFSDDEADYGRPRSRASSVPTDLEQVNLNALHARWTPSMRRRLDEMDRTEREHLSQARREQHEMAAAAAAADGNRRTQLNRYSELAEEF